MSKRTEAKPGAAAVVNEAELTDRSIAQLETVIADGLKSFVEVGIALLEIRDRRLYIGQGFHSFEDYCQERWKFSRQRGHQMIEAAVVTLQLSSPNVQEDSPMSTRVDTPPPQNERQARELVRLKEPQARANAWNEVVRQQGAQAPTGEVRAVVEEHVAVERYPELEQPGIPGDIRRTMAKALDALPAVERVEVRERLARGDSDALTSLAGKPPMPKGPTPEEEAAADPSRPWAKGMGEIHKLFSAVNTRGGFLSICQRWSPDTRHQYLDELRRVRAILHEFEMALEMEDAHDVA